MWLVLGYAIIHEAWKICHHIACHILSEPETRYKLLNEVENLSRHQNRELEIYSKSQEFLDYPGHHHTKVTFGRCLGVKTTLTLRN